MGIINSLITAMRPDPLRRIEKGLAKAENTQGPFDYVSLYQKFEKASNHLENAEAVRRLLFLLLEVDSVMVANARSISNRFIERGMETVGELNSALKKIDDLLEEAKLSEPTVIEPAGVGNGANNHYESAANESLVSRKKALKVREFIILHLDLFLRLHEEMVSYQRQRRQKVDGLEHLQKTRDLSREIDLMAVQTPFSPYSESGQDLYQPA